MCRGQHLLAILFLAAFSLSAQVSPDTSYEASEAENGETGSAPPAFSFAEAASRLPLRSYDRAALLLLPRPLPPAPVYQHRWERIHPIHIPSLCNLRRRFLRGIQDYRNWFSRTKVYPFASLNRGRFYLGVETREMLLVESDSREAVLARQVPGPRFFPFRDSDRRIAFTLRWNLD